MNQLKFNKIQIKQLFGALHLPAFPAVAALRTFPELRALPCAVVADQRSTGQAKAPLLAVNPAAAAWDLVPGWSAARARSRCPELRIIPRDPRSEELLSLELLQLAESLTPDFEQTRPDTLVLDLSSNRHPAPPPARDHLPGLRFRTAATPDLCLLAAFAEPPPGRAGGDHHWEPADFGPLPIELMLCAAIPGTARLLPTLQAWGIRSLGDFQQLPAPELSERLGPHAARLQSILNGGGQRPLRLHRQAKTFVQNSCFETPISHTEPLLFELKRLLDELCKPLESNHLAVGKIRLKLLFESADPLERHLTLPEPLASPATLIRPLQTIIESLRLPAPVVALELEFSPVEAGGAQRAWFGPRLRQPHRWADTLSHLEALLGPGNLGIATMENSHRPDTFQLRAAPGSLAGDRPAPPADGPDARQTDDSRLPPASPIPLRRFRPPLRVAVATGSGDGDHPGPRPLALLGGPHPGTITHRRGPFPLSGNWWSPVAWQQVEWDVQLAEGQLLRLAYRPPGDWRIEGIYP